MTHPSERSNTALLVIDVQNDVVAKAYQRDAVIARIHELVEKARAQGAPVIWIQHSDDDLAMNSDGWRYVPELQRKDSELLIHKHYGDSFEGTALEADLSQLGVGRLIVTGAQTDACIRSTIHGAFARGYHTFLVGDAHTTDDMSSYGLPSADKVIAHTNMYWKWQAAPGRTAGVLKTADVDFRPA